MITGTSPKCAISCNDHLLRHQAGIIHKPNNCVTVISDHANNDDEYDDDDDARPLMALRRTYMVAGASVVGAQSTYLKHRHIHPPSPSPSPPPHSLLSSPLSARRPGAVGGQRRRE